MASGTGNAKSMAGSSDAYLKYLAGLQKNTVLPATQVPTTNPAVVPQIMTPVQEKYTDAATSIPNGSQMTPYAGLVPESQAQALGMSTSATKSNPYLDLYAEYEKRVQESLAKQQEALRNQLIQSKQGTSANYNSAAAANYLNYMKQQNAMPEQLARLGVNGGASETAAMRMANNYALNQGSNEASRNAALASLQSAYDTNSASLDQSANDKLANAYMNLAQAQIQYDDTLKEREYQHEQDRLAREDAKEQQAYERKQAEEQLKREEKQASYGDYSATKAGHKAISKAIDKAYANYKKYKKAGKKTKAAKALEKYRMLKTRRGEIETIMLQNKQKW